MARKLMCFGDVHIPYHNKTAVSVFVEAVKHFKPDIVVCLGDLLDCSQFSVHPPTFGFEQTDFEEDLDAAKGLLDTIQKHCGTLVMLEGNHENRIDRWAARTVEGRGVYTRIVPRIQLSKTLDGKPRKRFVYIKYGSVDGRYPHYKINFRVMAVHGWSYAKHATKNHLDMSQGKSVIHGHTHRADSTRIQSIWRDDQLIQAHSCGCLCQRIPLYGTGRPVEWVNLFVMGWLGRTSEWILPIDILGNHCILPDGTRIDGKVQ